jgi:hypothetical protein
MQRIFGILMLVAWLGYGFMGLLGWSAIYSFYSDYLGWWFILAFPAAFITAYIPLVNVVLGVIAAHTVWKWQIPWAILLFAWPFVLGIVVSIFNGAKSVASKELAMASSVFKKRNF